MISILQSHHHLIRHLERLQRLPRTRHRAENAHRTDPKVNRCSFDVSPAVDRLSELHRINGEEG